MALASSLFVASSRTCHACILRSAVPYLSKHPRYSSSSVAASLPSPPAGAELLLRSGGRGGEDNGHIALHGVHDAHAPPTYAHFIAHGLTFLSHQSAHLPGDGGDDDGGGG